MHCAEAAIHARLHLAVGRSPIGCPLGRIESVIEPVVEEVGHGVEVVVGEARQQHVGNQRAALERDAGVSTAKRMFGDVVHQRCAPCSGDGAACAECRGLVQANWLPAGCVKYREAMDVSVTGKGRRVCVNAFKGEMDGYRRGEEELLNHGLKVAVVDVDVEARGIEGGVAQDKRKGEFATD